MLTYMIHKSKFIIWWKKLNIFLRFLVKSGKIAEIVQVSNKAVQDYIFPEKSLSYRYYYLIPKSIQVRGVSLKFYPPCTRMYSCPTSILPWKSVTTFEVKLIGPQSRLYASFPSVVSGQEAHFAHLYLLSWTRWWWWEPPGRQSRSICHVTYGTLLAG